METKFTPGPWRFEPAEEFSRSFEVMCEVGYYIATTHDWVRGESNGEANARLIAAAPDLLEALQEMVGLVELMCPFDGPQQRKARAAIAQATGDE